MTPREAFDRELPSARRFISKFLWNRYGHFIESLELRNIALMALWETSLKWAHLDARAFHLIANRRMIGAAIDHIRATEWWAARSLKNVPRASRVFLNGTNAWSGDYNGKDGGQFQLAAPEPDPDDDRLEEAKSALSRLPPRLARLMDDIYIKQIPRQQIARRMKVSDPRVSQLHTVALNLIREDLSKRDS